MFLSIIIYCDVYFFVIIGFFYHHTVFWAAWLAGDNFLVKKDFRKVLLVKVKPVDRAVNYSQN